jgi:lipopolysaccharide transport system permease protein
MAYYGVRPGWSIVLAPLLLLLITLAALGAGTLLAALNVAYRDFKYTIPFLVQLWMFATPTVYMQVQADQESGVRGQESGRRDPGAGIRDQGADASASRGPGSHVAPHSAFRISHSAWKPLLQLNPMTGVIAFFRAAVLGDRLPWGQLTYPTAVIAVLLCVALAYFRRVESSFADII